jgi:hypothetical protein
MMASRADQAEVPDWSIDSILVSISGLPPKDPNDDEDEDDEDDGDDEEEPGAVREPHE